MEVFSVGPLELMVVLVIALLVIGPKKLPEMGRSVGKGLSEFKGALRGVADGRDEEESTLLKWDSDDEDDALGDERRREEEERAFRAIRAEEEARARGSFPSEA